MILRKNRFKLILFLITIILLVNCVFLVNNYAIYKADCYYWQVIEFSDKYELEPNLVFAIIRAESKFNKRAISKKGACGLMQLMPRTAVFIAEKYNYDKKIDLFNADCNIELGCAYLNYLSNSFVNEKTLLCAYNAGEGVVRKWLSDKNYSIDGLTLNKIGFKETSVYYERVTRFKRDYQKYLTKKGYYE